MTLHEIDQELESIKKARDKMKKLSLEDSFNDSVFEKTTTMAQIALNFAWMERVQAYAKAETVDIAFNKDLK